MQILSRRITHTDDHYGYEETTISQDLPIHVLQDLPRPGAGVFQAKDTEDEEAFLRN